MKTEKIRCLDLPEGVPVPQFETMKEASTHVKGDETKLLDVLNKYGRQKDSLVNARDWLSDQVEQLGLKRVTKDGKPTTADTEDADLETEGKHLERAVDAAIKGTFKAQGLTVTGKDDKEKAASVWAYFQGLINKHGDFPFDLNATQRVGKARKIPQHALNGARTIISNKSEGKWEANFTNGFDFDGIKIDPIAFAPFTTKVPAGTSEADAAAIRKANEENLARAIASAFDQRAQKSAEKKFV